VKNKLKTGQEGRGRSHLLLSFLRVVAAGPGQVCEVFVDGGVEGGKVSYIARVPVHLMNGFFFFFL
jgi:hypothetical protein